MQGQALAETLTAILADLIAIPSDYPPGDTRAISAYAAERLRRAGYEVEILGRVPGVDNVVAERRGRTDGPFLAFNAHADTVGAGEPGAWSAPPFTAVMRDGRVFGLGAGNCKGSMAVQLWLAEEIACRGGPARGRLMFTFVGDEERLGPDGLAWLRESGRVRPDILVLGAQTENGLIIEERGVLWVRVTARGRAAHAGNPAAGDNAILRMLRLLAALEAGLAPLLVGRRLGDKQSTMSLGQIRGGHNTNVVPNLCTAEIDRRLLPGERVEDAFREIEQALAAAKEPPDSYAVELLTGTSGFSAPADGPGVTAFAAAIAARTGKPARFLNATGVSDGRYFADDGIEIMNFGPGSGSEGHAADESVPVAQLVEAALIQLDAVERLLGFGS